MKWHQTWLGIKVCLFLGWFGIRWKVSQIDCDHCHEPIAVNSDLTIDAHVNPDQSVICSKCLDLEPKLRL